MVIKRKEISATYLLFACDPVALARAQAPRFVQSDAEPVPSMTFDVYLALHETAQRCL